MPMPMRSVAAAASQGPVCIHLRDVAVARLSKWAFSITCHISSSGGSGTLKSSGRLWITSSKRFSSIFALLLECSQRFSQLRSCRGEPALAGPLGDAKDLGDFRVRVSLYVVHYQRRSIDFGQVLNCSRDALLQIRFCFRSGLDGMRFVERHLTCNSYF